MYNNYVRIYIYIVYVATEIFYSVQSRDMAHAHHSYTLPKSGSTDIATDKSNREVKSMSKHVVVKSGVVYYKPTKIGFLKVSIN